MIYDLAILGGGPAGIAAGVYASRKQLKTVFITKDYQSQSVVSEGIENWIGEVSIPGAELAKKFENHLKAYAGEIVDVREGEWISKVEKSGDHFLITTTKGAETSTYEAKAVLVSTGSHRRKLEAANADVFEHKGITYCASCDGPIFAGKDVVVVGGGNAGFETAIQLLAYAKSVTLLNRSAEFKADPVTIEAAKRDPKMRIITNAVIKEVRGEKFVNGLTYTDATTGEEKTLDIQGIFVEIGSVPTTEFVAGLVNLTPYGQIIVDPRTQRASCEGIWAAGDCTDGLYHQNNIAAGDAVKALEDIYLWVKSKAQ